MRLTTLASRLTTSGKMELRHIDLADYQLSGGGKMGESYTHRSDPDLLLKLYPPRLDAVGLEEYERACKVFRMGIPSPEPGEPVRTKDGRLGILYKRIIGKKSYARALSEHPERVEEYAAEFARMSKLLHAVRPEPRLFPTAKEQYKKEIGSNPFLSPEEHAALARFIDALPDADTAVHADLHHGNIIFTEDGRQYFIDLGDFCTGTPLFDIGIMLLHTCWLPEETEQRLYHIDLATSRAFWKAFVPAYFGPDAVQEEIEELVSPYAFLRILINERVLKEPVQAIRPKLHALIGL